MTRRLLVCLGAAFIAAASVPVAHASDEPATLAFMISPATGPPGTRVRFEGDVPLDAPDFSNYQMPDFAYGLDLIEADVATSPDCALILPMDDLTKTVTPNGHVTGSFTVGAVGGCFMSPTDLGPQRARPGVYSILLSCHACTPIGTFRVTSEPLAKTGHAMVPLTGVGVGLITLGLSLAWFTRRRAHLSHV